MTEPFWEPNPYPEPTGDEDEDEPSIDERGVNRYFRLGIDEFGMDRAFYCLFDYYDR